MTAFVRSSVVLALLLAVAPAAEAQTQPRKSLVTTRVAVVSDATVCACDDAFLDTPRRRDLVIVAVGRRFSIGSGGGRWQLDYVPEFLPLFLSHNTADEQLEVWVCGPRRYCGRSQGDDVFNVTSYGIGLMPLGVMTGLRISERVHLRTRVSAGGVQLSRPVPLAQGTKFNFIADGAASVEIRASSGVAFSAGFALNHVSNGGIGRVNLGMDSRMVEIGAVIGR